MTKQRTPSQPLDEDFDSKIETLAREKGVSTMVKPDRTEQGPGAGNTAPAAIMTPSSRMEAAEVSAEMAASRTATKTLNVELPDYVWTALKIRAAERKTRGAGGGPSPAGCPRLTCSRIW